MRWVALTDGEGAGLLAVGMPYLEVSAHHYTTADLTQARHLHELHWRPEITLNLDYRQMGLGGASCGPATRPEYVLPSPQRSSRCACVVWTGRAARGTGAPDTSGSLMHVEGPQGPSSRSARQSLGVGQTPGVFSGARRPRCECSTPACVTLALGAVWPSPGRT